MVGSTESVGTFTTTPGAWDTTLEGNYDGFLVKLGIGTDLSVQTSDLVDPVYLPPRSSLRGHRSQQISRISTPPTTRTTRER